MFLDEPINASLTAFVELNKCQLLTSLTVTTFIAPLIKTDGRSLDGKGWIIFIFLPLHLTEDLGHSGHSVKVH